MSYDISTVATILETTFPASLPNSSVRQLVIDSRKIIFPEQSLFFALRGQRQDGHDFISEAYAKGVRHFVVAHMPNTQDYPNANFLQVKNPLRALQKLAAHHRRQFQIPVLGITGSNGKTVVKEWLFQLLQHDINIIRSPRSYNSQIGVALSAWQLQQRHELAILEAGISRMDEMEHLAKIIEPTIGLFTNIGPAHQEGFPSLEEKVRQKAQLFKTAEILVYCKDHTLIATILNELYPEKTHHCWSAEQSANVKILDQKIVRGHTEFAILFDNTTYHFSIPYTDVASIENILHCWTVASLLRVDLEKIGVRSAQLEPIAMRLEVREGINRCTLINDSYNADLNALTIALHFLDQQGTTPKRTLILSDILETGEPQNILYQKVAELLRAHRVNRFIGIGPSVESLSEMLPHNIEQRYFNSTADFLKVMRHADFQQETILLKGARRFQFEKIATLLSQKVHRTVLEVNLDALAHNLNVFNKFLQPETQLIVMVKAAAYGSGSKEVAKLLEYKNVDYLAVAYADEGVELRESGIELPILVLNPEQAIFDTLLRYRLEPEIYTLELLRQFAQYTIDVGNSVPIHLKLDTGMHRLGFTEKELPELLALLQQHKQLYVQTIFSHLAASETSEHDAFTEQQVQTFQQLYDEIVKILPHKPHRHILNSSGIVRFPQHQMEMVRLGIGLYGIDNSQQIQNELKTVLTLKATISQIKTLSTGETVGYGRSGKVQHPMRTATISIGYADGLLRSAGQGQFSVLVRGQLAPTFGNICMDMTMIDVSHISAAQEGDEVIIFGPNHPITALAESLGTIPYEVLTGVSQRVKRMYVQE